MGTSVKVFSPHSPRAFPLICALGNQNAIYVGVYFQVTE